MLSLNKHTHIYVHIQKINCRDSYGQRDARWTRASVAAAATAAADLNGRQTHIASEKTPEALHMIGTVFIRQAGRQASRQPSMRAGRLASGQAGRQASSKQQAGKQASRQACKQAGRQASSQAVKQSSRQASSSMPILSLA